MLDKPVIKVSVQALVDYYYLSGDIQISFRGSSRMTEGIKRHQLVQQAAGENYLPEEYLTISIEKEDLILEINGRADGILQTEEGILIEEIKTTYQHLDSIKEDDYPVHWAQAKCYGYMYALERELEHLDIQLTYCQMESSETKSFRKTFTIQELKLWFDSVVEEYLRWATILQRWRRIRNQSITEQKFPFAHYRKGQRNLAVAAYRTIRDGKKLFVQAPTGIGKTIAVLFPSLKALGEGLTSKIFYLTAKTSTQAIAEKALENMRQSGLRVKSLTITAKEKICFKEKLSCDPVYCEFARGHFNRVKEAVKDIYQQDCLTRPVVEEYARKHQVCPFEYSLDISNEADVVICDYNYVFDPRVYLKRFFMEPGGDYTFLIDEAHNLVDRAREMYSAEITKKSYLQLKKETKLEIPRLAAALNKINSFLLKARKQCKENREKYLVQKEKPEDIFPLLKKCNTLAEKWLVKNKPTAFRDELIDLFFDNLAMLRTSELYDERYISYYEILRNDVKLKLFCLDPSFLLKEAMKRGRSAVLFSATLTPMDYFIKILGGEEDSGQLQLISPFPRKNLCLLLDDQISTKYKNRPMTYDRITESISSVIEWKTGNYLVYFPSYQYLKEIHQRFSDSHPEMKILCQRMGMKDMEREEFLQQFSEYGKETMVGFAVLGGIFGEGIDLVGDRLSGAIIIGVGLPQICLERDLIQDYFQESLGKGFEYAYTFPGMNRVLQAAGRVIRTEIDKGVVLLIDERFSQGLYRRLYPPEWQHLQKIRDKETLTRILKRF